MRPHTMFSTNGRRSVVLPGRLVFAWIVISTADSQLWRLTSIGSGWTLQRIFVYLPATTQSAPATSRSFGLGYGDLLGGHGPSATGRSASPENPCWLSSVPCRRRLSHPPPPGVPQLRSRRVGAVLWRRLPAKLPFGLATLGPSTLSTWPRQSRQLRTHVRFVEHVCSKLESPTW